jgi:hypothetical protein
VPDADQLRYHPSGPNLKIGERGPGNLMNKRFGLNLSAPVSAVINEIITFEEMFDLIDIQSLMTVFQATLS